MEQIADVLDAFDLKPPNFIPVDLADQLAPSTVIDANELLWVARILDSLVRKRPQQFLECLAVFNLRIEPHATFIASEYHRHSVMYGARKRVCVRGQDRARLDRRLAFVPSLPKSNECKWSFIFESVIPRLLEFADPLPFVVAVSEHQAAAPLEGRAE